MATGFSVFVNIGGKVNPSLANAVNAAKGQVNGLATSLAGIGARINTPFAAAQKHIDATAKRFQQMQRKGAGMFLGVTAPATWFGAAMIRDAADYAKAGNMMQALGEATASQRQELEKLSQSLAARYDAGGATGIMKTATELLKAGFTFEQAKGSLEQVLATSTLAGDMNAADVGAALSKSLIQFQMPIATTEQISASAAKIADRLAYSAVKTVASTRDMTEAFKYVGGISAATGNSLDATTATIMAFAKAGVLGSEAGVALRSAIVRLVKMPKGGMAALTRVGMNLSDYTSARPITANGVVAGLQSSGIDASKIAPQIAAIIKAQGGQAPNVLAASITKAVQSHLGSTSAIDADTIASSVTDAITAAGSKVDVTRFFTDLKAKMDSGAATMGDIAQILEARHISRYQALLRTDLNSLIAQIGAEAEGFAQTRYELANQGLPAEILKLDAAYKGLRNTLVEAVTPEIVSMFERLGAAMKSLAETSPKTLKLGIGVAAAAAAAGPLLFALGMLGRVAMFALKGLAGGLALLLAPIGLVSRGLGMMGVALAAGMAGALARIRALAAGLMVLSAVGGGSAVFSALGASLLAFGRAILMFPVTALRAIGLAMWALVANPVGLIITGIVAALAALGVWVYNNWNGIKSFFTGFAEGFMEGLGPARPAIEGIVSALSSAVNWLNQMLGPLNATNEQWKAWGATVGGAAAAGVNAIISAIQRLIGFFDTVIGKAAAVGSAIRNMFSAGGGKGPAAPAPIAGARALGGPVAYGKPYLVGEHGPELFVPGATGRVETNNRLRRLTADGATAVAQSPSESRPGGGAITITNHWTINGADDPRSVASQIDSRFAVLVRQLESEQRGLLSD